VHIKENMFFLRRGKGTAFSISSRLPRSIETDLSRRAFPFSARDKRTTKNDDNCVASTVLFDRFKL